MGVRADGAGDAVRVRGDADAAPPDEDGRAEPVRAGVRARPRLLAALAALGTIGLALCLRALWPATDFAKYAGDALYTVLIACLCLALAPALTARRAAPLALALSWAVELLQLWPSLADLSARHTLARYAIGSTFNAPDLFWYAAGAALAAAVLAPVTRAQGEPR
ncbi:DUF2809 domain-containing protein [Streptomyces sp. P6-2-1]|uniref:ribosomal maturation YjgA family protein n=1 Tax=Streptomyces sp. P6-2-1 TaxID=3422591 RepID=UPI003D35A4BC